MKKHKKAMGWIVPTSYTSMKMTGMASSLATAWNAQYPENRSRPGISYYKKVSGKMVDATWNGLRDGDRKLYSWPFEGRVPLLRSHRARAPFYKDQSGRNLRSALQHE